MPFLYQQKINMCKFLIHFLCLPYIYLWPSYFIMSYLYQQKLHFCKFSNVFLCLPYIYLWPSYFTMSDLYQQKFHMCKIFNVFHIYPISTILVYLSKTYLFYYVRLTSTKILHVQNSQCILCLPCLNNSSIFIYDLAILLCPTYINKKSQVQIFNK